MEAIRLNPSAKRLDLSKQRLLKFPRIEVDEDGSSHENHSLEFIDMSSNFILDIPSVGRSRLSGTPLLFHCLRRIVLSSNELSAIPICLAEAAPFLTELFLNNNNLENMNGIEKFKHLQVLDLKQNRIKAAANLESLSSSLTWLSLSCNRLEDIRSIASVSANLEFLGLFGNCLSDFNALLDVLRPCKHLLKAQLGGNPFCFTKSIAEGLAASSSSPIPTTGTWQQYVYRTVPTLQWLDSSFVALKSAAALGSGAGEMKDEPKS